MARVTVEDCILNIPNRFDLVITAAQRAKQIASGVPLTLDRDNDKDAVVSLREVAEKTIDLNMIQEEIVQNFQKKTGFDASDTLEDEEGAFARRNRELDDAFEDARNYVSEQSQQLPGSLSFVEDNIEVED
ncbi:MAG: DNA-directed RNA polymerase subunit omega [Alphaproteobacteria bacterium]|nr:DNA-directed RNA polymerase subunit omega [Alphaproteobacteria bacterium]